MSTDRSDPTLAYTLPVQLTQTIHRSVPKELQPEDEANSQKGKIIVITGGGTGIGAAAANVWVRAGAEGVVITGRRQSRLDDTAKELKNVNNGNTTVLPIAADVTEEEDMQHVYDEIKQIFGRGPDVVLANAAAAMSSGSSAEHAISEWWKAFEINMLGLHNTVATWIKSQAEPKNPVGTVILVSSAMEGMVFPGFSSYSISKLAGHRYMDYLGEEYRQLRTFTLLPGIVKTDMSDPAIVDFAKDEAEQTGAMALYLASPRADYLKGSLTSINWDISEMEARKDDIEKGMLKINWIPVLPVSGGSGI